MELITIKDSIGDFINDLTKEMDNHLTEDNCKAFGTYIYDHQIHKNHWAIRYPGATRGHILVDDNNVIQDIKLYDTATDSIKSVGCYKDSVKDAVKKFIGYKIVFN